MGSDMLAEPTVSSKSCSSRSSRLSMKRLASMQVSIVTPSMLSNVTSITEEALHLSDISTISLPSRYSPTACSTFSFNVIKDWLCEVYLRNEGLYSPSYTTNVVFFREIPKYRRFIRLTHLWRVVILCFRCLSFYITVRFRHATFRISQKTDLF